MASEKLAFSPFFQDDLFHSSLKDFFIKAGGLHTGGCDRVWRTGGFLLPLFIFCDLSGGLSLDAIYAFTITTSIMGLLLFYAWVRKYWREETALLAVFFLGLSAVFQEVARSGSYIALSTTVALAWIAYLYWCVQTDKIIPYLFLGLFMGILMYGYGLFRSLALVPFIYILWSGKNNKIKILLAFFSGVLLPVLPGVILQYRSMPGFYAQHPLELFLAREDIVTFGFYAQHFQCFINRMTGGKQTITALTRNNYHAHFLHRLLLIPLIIGVLRCWNLRKEWTNKLLLILAFIIFFTPFLTSGTNCNQARRYVGYIIPTYLFIGYGMEFIFRYVSSRQFITSVSRIAMVVLCTTVVLNEFAFSRDFIINRKRDLGLLDFADILNTTVIQGNVYYLEMYPCRNCKGHMGPFNESISTVYRFTQESTILRLALLKPGHSKLRILSIDGFEKIGQDVKVIYLVKSPLIPEHELLRICQKHGYTLQLLFQHPVVYFSDPGFLQSRDTAFKLYKIAK